MAALDPDLPQATGTYDKLIQGLQAAGWTADKDLLGAPYDFRLAADGLQQVRLDLSPGAHTCVGAFAQSCSLRTSDWQ